MTGADKEALRQQMLLRALLGDARPGVVGGWLRDGARFERGLVAYQANAAALAERALAAAFPTLQQLLGEDSFAQLARHFWRRQPPQAGDMALWGESLPAFVADAESLADEPYLPDLARLEWAVHRAASAADAAAPVGLEQLAETDPAALQLRLAPGSALVESAHPVATIWWAHRSHAADRFEPVRQALAEARAETALVYRQGWAAQVRVLAPPEARFTTALLAGRSLGQALQAAGAGFDFEPWLIAALQVQLLAAVQPLQPQDAPR
jgi:hypothetical protein